MAEQKKINIFNRIFMIIVIPLFVYLFFQILCVCLGIKGFTSWTNLQSVLQTTIYTSFITWAFSFNLANGRFDFSIGSLMILSNMLGVHITNMFGLNAFGMLIAFVVCGAVLGLVSGVLYVVLKVSPMVSSIGMTMIFEALASIVSGGKAVSMIGRSDLLVFSSGWQLWLLALAGLALCFFLSNHTVFGLNFKALGGGQAVTVSVGVNEKRNAILCYILAGGLMAAAGIVQFSYLGTWEPKSGLASTQYMMNSFLPLFIGLALSKFIDNNVGILIGSFTQSLITLGFSKLGVSMTLQTVLNAVIVLGFLYFETRRMKSAEKKMFAAKRQMLKIGLREKYE